jgi:ABC-type nitrate/sulfonate/bicarbonate transport system permease component
MTTNSKLIDQDVLPKKSFWTGRETYIQVAVVIVVLAIWQLVGKKVGDFILAPPSALITAAFEITKSGELLRATLDSIYGLLIGFAAALIIGIGLGFLMGWYRPLAIILDPFVSALYVVPIAALVPLFIVWMGIGATPRIVCITLFSVFEILIATFTGVRNVDQRLIEMARSLGANQSQMFRKVVFFAALPVVFAGVRIGAGRAVKGMVVAELLFAVTGLGGLVMTYAVYYQTAKMLVIVVVLALIGVLLTGFAQLVERKLAPWWQMESK